MSDYTDYENNLAFAPTSADDLGEQGRQSEVLIKALEKCEKLEKMLKIAIECLVTVDATCDTCSFRTSHALHQIDELGQDIEELFE